MRGRAADQSWVLDADEADIGDVPRGGEDALVKIPDGLVGIGKVLGQEAATVRAAEDAGVAPGRIRRTQDRIGDRAEVEDVDHQQIARLSALDGDRAAEDVAGG